MLCSYYGQIDDDLYLSSHFQLIADLCGLKHSKYIDELINYKFYPKYGRFLPGDLSAYSEIKRIVPNTYIEYFNKNFNIRRFYPLLQSHDDYVFSELLHDNSYDYDEIIRDVSKILHNSLLLISDKWKKPAISMTGGMDSKTTLSCANGLYNKFSYFSYLSMYGESIDANAAHEIAKIVGVSHNIYKIDKEKFSDELFLKIREIMAHNYGDIGYPNNNDVYKRMFFFDTDEFDIEVKSWVSEVARANYYKKFGKKKMPKTLTPRNMSSMYKLFLHNRKLLSKTDKVFGEYLKNTCFKFNECFDESDMYLWEFRYGAWGGLVITCEHLMSYNITIPYNNRKLLDLLLKTPLESRIKDDVHNDIIKLMNKKIFDNDINIVNYNETKTRMIIEKLYFNINSILPF